MSYENIQFTTEGNIALVTLNRPLRRNALSLELMQELIDCVDTIGGRMRMLKWQKQPTDRFRKC